MAIQLEELLLEVPVEAKTLVDRTRKRVSSAVREAIRQETGLLLNRYNVDQPDRDNRVDAVSVPVSLLPGMPVELEGTEFDDDFWLIEKLSRYRRTLESFWNVSLDMDRLFCEMVGDKRAEDVLQGRHRLLSPLTEMTEEMLKRLDEVDPVKKVLAVDKDVLGVYQYDIPSGLFGSGPGRSTIELYWAAIGLVASWLGLTVESLTVVVLVHELAHAYTHLGADIDSSRWDSQEFSESDHALKEGLAQYYTALVCPRMDRHVPGSGHAYEELLKRQPAAYQTHGDWLEHGSPEEIRLAMLEVRRRGKASAKIFNQALQAAQRRLRDTSAGQRES